MPAVYIGLGSNLNAPRRQIESAIEALRQLPETDWLGVSPLYRSQPVGPQDQPDYVNAVAAIDTRLSPLQVLDALQAIEQQHGRRRGERWGPRTLDLDVLLYGDEIIKQPRLTIPHPEMPRRGFVLRPLYDLAPALIIPGVGAVTDLLAQVSTADLEKVSDVE